MKMKKLIASLALLTVFISSVLIPTAAADEPTEDTALLLEGNTYTVATGEEFIAAADAINAADSGEFTIELGADIDLNTVAFSKNTITVIGNGHTIYLLPSAVITISGGTLNLGSAENDTELTVSAEKRKSFASAMISVDGNGGECVLNMYDHTTICDLELAYSSGTMGVNVLNGVFNMYGGTITNINSDYGAVYISHYGLIGDVPSYGAVFNMYGGEITNSNTFYSAVSIVGDSTAFNMYNGSIKDNASRYYYSGGVFSYNGTVTMSGGEISGNKAIYYGGGLCLLDSSFTMTGGEISGNDASYGGGLFIQEEDRDIELNINGGTIKDNLSGRGGGMYMGTDGEGALTANISNATITGNDTDTYGGAFYFESTVTVNLSGTNIIKDNTAGDAKNNLFIGSSNPINITGSLEGSEIGLTDANGTGEALTRGYSSYNSADPPTYFTSDNDELLISYTKDKNEVRLRGDEPTEKIGVVFEPVADSPYEYLIKLKALSERSFINRFMSTDLAFENSNAKINYEIAPPEGVDIGITEYDSDKPKTREFHFEMNGLGDSDMTGAELTIGRITFEGYGHLDFSIDMDYTSNHAVNIVNTAFEGENVVRSYDLTAGLIVNKTVDDDYGDFLTEGQSGVIEADYAIPKRTLTVNIEFPNYVMENNAAYQDMTMMISGGDLAESKVIPLGTDAEYTGIDPGHLSKAYYTSVGRDPAYYSVELREELSEDIAYTVTLEGAGYRTARYTVLMSGDKELTFWNNVATAAKVIETGSARRGVVKNFLAGDIVKDNEINIYDLSAVISYFGSASDRGSEWEYAKYDLNRDGAIDSKDIAYVLVSWGN